MQFIRNDAVEAQHRKKDEDRPKLRVAAYCRVSTDSDEQATSYETQIEHYTAYIQKNPEWELAGIFADDGLSGTDTRKRGQFNLLIEECMAGNRRRRSVRKPTVCAFGRLECGRRTMTAAVVRTRTVQPTVTKLSLAFFLRQM